MLQTATRAAKMVEDRRSEPSPLKLEISGPNSEDYRKLKTDFDELTGKFEELKQGQGKRSTSFSIDEYGTIHSDLPWLTRLIDLNRTTAVIVKHLMEHGRTTSEDIARKYGFSVDTIRDRLNELVKKGVVSSSDSRPHRYSLREQ
jgi:predicted HTH transcriptional regulator